MVRLLTKRLPTVMARGLTLPIVAMGLASCSPAGGGQASYGTDFWDDRKLVGFADDEFLGQVIENRGFSAGPGGRYVSEITFRVEVLETLKGSLSGEVTVRQGREFFDVTNKEEFLGEPALLEQRDSYLLATRFSQARG